MKPLLIFFIILLGQNIVHSQQLGFHQEQVNGKEVKYVYLSSELQDMNPLFIASLKGKLEEVRSKMKNGDVNLKNNYNLTPLLVASINGHTEIVKLLIDNGADIDSKSDLGETSLIIASKNGYSEIVKLLIDNGADLNFITDEGVNSLIAVLSEEQQKIEIENEELKYTKIIGLDSDEPKRYEVMKLLINNGININLVGDKNTTALNKALLLQRQNYIDLLVSNNVDIDLNSIRIATIYGYKSIIEEVVKKNYNLDTLFNKQGSSPLIVASINGHTEIVKLLIGNGANVNLGDNKGKTPLVHASINGHTEIVKLLIDNGANVNLGDNKEKTPLVQASINGHAEIVKLLIDNGANVNLGDNKTIMPLIETVGASKYKIAKLLIDNGANVNSIDKYGQTPIKKASENGNLKIVKLLIDNGANITNSNGIKALFATERNYVYKDMSEIVKLLIDNGVSINAQNSKGRTLLMNVVKGSFIFSNGGVLRIKFLLDNGANVNLKDKNGDTALSIAKRLSDKTKDRKTKKKKVLSLLKKYK